MTKTATIDGQRRTKRCEEHARKTIEMCEAWLEEKSVPDVGFIDFLAMRWRQIRTDWQENKIG